MEQACQPCFSLSLCLGKSQFVKNMTHPEYLLLSMSFSTGFEKFHSLYARMSDISTEKLVALDTNEETKESHNFIKSLRDATQGNFQKDA